MKYISEAFFVGDVDMWNGPESPANPLEIPYKAYPEIDPEFGQNRCGNLFTRSG